MGNNRVGWKVLEWISDRENVVGLAVHPEDDRKHGEDILNAVDLPSHRVLDASALDDPEIRDRIQEMGPDIGLSCFLGYILEEETIDLFPEGIVNLHPAYLPYNRGAYPNVWSIIDGTPAGATLHYLDEDIDTGPIIARREVDVRADDTGQDLYNRLEQACIRLLKEAWPDIRDGTADLEEQDPDKGTYHETKDVEEIDAIDPEAEYTARELIDILRARTFPPHDGAFLETDEGRVYLELDLELREDSR